MGLSRPLVTADIAIITGLARNIIAITEAGNNTFPNWQRTTPQ